MCLTPKFKKFNWFVKLITFNWPTAITLSPFGIYVNQKYKTIANLGDRTKNHESIHWRQQLETLILFFYPLYLIEFILKFLYYWNFNKTYRNLSSEREAYHFDDDMSYLEARRRYHWLKYIFTKP